MTIQDKFATIKVFDIVGEYALSGALGQSLFARITQELETHPGVILDFDGVKCIIAAFYHYGIGQLLHSYTPSKLNEMVKIKGLSNIQEKTLRQCIETAKNYYGHTGNV